MNGPDEMRGATESELDVAGLERELQHALQPVEPPQGFADRLMARALLPEAPPVLGMRRPTPARLHHWTQWRVWTAGAIAAAAVIGYIGAEKVQERREQERAAAVQQQFDTAMRVTNHALDQTRAQLARAGFRLNLPAAEPRDE